ncbi:hypothetical protein GUITHDRAFT_139533 [Guillardia theta CCMP2712]|uniref:Uncharacterized protein n=2 Tax=Guillardia theta TaxID=55529 RepID=L1J7S9_GUITC|nr:hypothetical protein GUITHDRAFT_139533 [Guillardia theta CCMP2712]EKX44586.1 hypothetical protein GUITHDRAFT_139533 [Guillardia theta CCMP2712]|eukprot:XP_005831566.1 hypothetical protein GUITHDRAFT_139533 [Guillardia theta CCMP2712]
MARTLVVRAAGAAILGALVCLIALERAGEANTFALADADGLTVREPNGDEIEMNHPGWQQWIDNVKESGADRELRMYEVQDGELTVREPNGDVIEMNHPGWKDWISHVEDSGADRELGIHEVQKGDVTVREPNGDMIDMDAPGWKGWIRGMEGSTENSALPDN